MSIKALREVEPSFVIDLGPGLFLGSDGIFYRERPANARTYRPLHTSLSLSDAAKATLDGQSLRTMEKKFGTWVLEDLLHINPDIISLFSKAAEVIGTIYNVVGYVQIAMKLLNALMLGPGEEDPLKKIAEKLNTIENVVKGRARQDLRDKIDRVMAEASTAEQQLSEYLRAPDPYNPQLRNELISVKKDILKAVHELIDNPMNALSMFEPKDYYKTNWYTTYHWLVPADVSGISSNLGLPSTSPGQPYRNKQDGSFYWDYRPFVPPIVQAVTIALTYFKAIDPAFRTTGRYYDELKKFSDNLKLFAANWFQQSFQWTRDYDPFGDKVSAPMAKGWPVGAVDICSGLAAYNPSWKEGVIPDPSWHPNTDYPFEPQPVLNVKESLQRAKEERDQALIAVFMNSGLPQFLMLIGHIDHLLTLPEFSETVDLNVKKEGAVEESGRETRCVEPLIACPERKCWEAKVYTIANQVTVLSTTQPILFQQGYPITYRYFLESYSEEPSQYQRPIQRIELSFPQGTVTLSASCYDWEVKSCDPMIGCFVPVKLPDWRELQTGPADTYHDLLVSQSIKFHGDGWGKVEDKPGIAVNNRTAPIHIDYDITKEDGFTTIRLRNHPGDASFRYVYLVVEESSPAGPGTIRTMEDVSMIGLEYHLPREYFKYREDCITRSALFLEEIKNRARLQRLHVPRWDPWKYPQAVDYVKWVAREYPQVIKDIQGLEIYR